MSIFALVLFFLFRYIFRYRYGYRFFSFFLPCFLLCFFSFPLLLIAEDPVIEEGVRTKGASSSDSLLKEIWEKNMDLDMGFSRTFGSEDAVRQLFFVSLDFQREIWPWLKVRFGGKYYHQEVQFKIDVKKDNYGSDPEPPPQDGEPPSPSNLDEDELNRQEVRLFDSKLDKTVLRDAYLQFNLGESLVLTAGQQTIVWGQLDLFSPVDFLLPLDFSSPLSYAKVDMRLPMTAVKLSWFPTSRLELQGYYFPKITFDDTVREELERDRGRNFLYVNAEGQSEYKEVKFNEPKEQGHYATRLPLLWGLGHCGVDLF